MSRKDTGKIDWDYKPRTVRRPRRNPQRYLDQVSSRTRVNLGDYHQEATLRGLLQNHRKSSKNPHLTDLPLRGGRRRTRRGRKSRYTRRR